MNKFSVEEVRKALLYAKTTVEFEGFTVTSDMEDIITQVIQGAISEAEFIQRALEQAIYE